MTTLSSLPSDVLKLILAQLNLMDVLRVCSTSQALTALLRQLHCLLLCRHTLKRSPHRPISVAHSFISALNLGIQLLDARRELEEA